MKPSDEQAPFAAATGSAVDATARRNTERAESVIRKVVARTGLAYQDENLQNSAAHADSAGSAQRKD